LGLEETRADTAAILSAASAGNAFGAMVVSEVGKLNALGVANTVNMFDPSLITIGGGVALSHPDLLLGPIRDLVPRYSVNRVPEIMITPLGDDAGILGALSLVFGR
jgi:glucokinase